VTLQKSELEQQVELWKAKFEVASKELQELKGRLGVPQQQVSN